MKVFALIDVHTDLATDANGFLAEVPSSSTMGYAVFEAGEMLSPVFSAYAHAQAWIDDQGDPDDTLAEF